MKIFFFSMFVLQCSEKPEVDIDDKGNEVEDKTENKVPEDVTLVVTTIM
jgi:hypothetical protein